MKTNTEGIDRLNLEFSFIDEINVNVIVCKNNNLNDYAEIFADFLIGKNIPENPITDIERKKVKEDFLLAYKFIVSTSFTKENEN